MVRTGSYPSGFAATFLAHLRAVDPDAAVSEPGSMLRLVDDWLRPRRFNLGLLGSFALTAVLLAVPGLHGLISYSVSQRKRELGMRMALGATGAAIQRMVLLQAARLGVAGASVSLLVAAAIRPLLESTLQSVAVNPSLFPWRRQYSRPWCWSRRGCLRAVRRASIRWSR
jgi:putative ABC transport system permease protein